MAIPTPQQTYDIGRQGNTVNTNGLPYRVREAIDATVNAGRYGK